MTTTQIRIDHVMLKFLATTENQKLRSSEDSRYNCGKIDGNYYSEIAIRNFTRSCTAKSLLLKPKEQP